MGNTSSRLGLLTLRNFCACKLLGLITGDRSRGAVDGGAPSVDRERIDQYHLLVAAEEGRRIKLLARCLFGY